MFLGPLLIAGGFALLTSALSKSSLENLPKEPQLLGYNQNKVLAVGGLAGSVLLGFISPPLAMFSAILGGSAAAAELTRLQVKDGVERNLWAIEAEKAQIEAAKAETAPNPPAAAAAKQGWFDKLLSPFFDHPVPEAP